MLTPEQQDRLDLLNGRAPRLLAEMRKANAEIDSCLGWLVGAQKRTGKDFPKEFTREALDTLLGRCAESLGRFRQAGEMYADDLAEREAMTGDP